MERRREGRSGSRSDAASRQRGGSGEAISHPCPSVRGLRIWASDVGLGPQCLGRGDLQNEPQQERKGG